tara:strand:+ start:156 stop:425 length:270 start_codon:yes stop_codon:yes gene_type:complete
MSIIEKTTDEIVKQFSENESNTGSTAVQIALLTKKINNLTEHLKINKKDFSGQRGLLKMVSQRRKLSKYLIKIDPAQYEKIKSELGLRK